MIDKINSWPPSNSASSQRRTRTRPMSLQYLITRSAVVCIRVRVSCKIVLLVLCSTYGMGTRLVYKSVVFKRLFSNSGHTIENHKQQDRICYSKKKKRQCWWHRVWKPLVPVVYTTLTYWITEPVKRRSSIGHGIWHGDMHVFPSSRGTDTIYTSIAVVVVIVIVIVATPRPRRETASDSIVFPDFNRAH